MNTEEVARRDELQHKHDEITDALSTLTPQQAEDEHHILSRSLRAEGLRIAIELDAMNARPRELGES